MAAITIGCGQITWGQFRQANGEPWPEERVLAEIADAGYAGAPAGPRAGRTAAETMALYVRHGLRPAPGYLSGLFWEPDQRASLLEQARVHGAFAAELGLAELYVAASGFDHLTPRGLTRRQVAGHVAPEDALDGDQYRRFAEVLNEVGAITLGHGVRSCFHNHVGTVIETRDEIDRLLALVDPAVVSLGPDTGHLAWGGADPVAFCRDYADRIRTLHLKDIDASVLRRGQAAGWDYHRFTGEGIFTELGDGDVDFPAILDLLRGAAFSGWAIVETDVTRRPTALESATVSRRYLRTIGV